MEEEIILLQDFINGKIQQDKLENYKGGYKLGFFYTKDLQKAIENLIARNKELESALDNYYYDKLLVASSSQEDDNTRMLHSYIGTKVDIENIKIIMILKLPILLRQG